MTRSQSTPASSQIIHLESRVESLEEVLRRQMFIEDRYEELKLSARRVLRYNGVDREMCDAAMVAMDKKIQIHQREIDDMEEPDHEMAP